MSGIHWIASYPKSGNTWLRVLIINYLSESDQPARINALHAIPTIEFRGSLDDALQVDSVCLTPAEIDALRPDYYRMYAASLSRTINCVKTHECFHLLPNGEPVIRPDATRGVVYIIRNPLDVVVSYAHHSHATFDTMIESMENEDNVLAAPQQESLHMLPVSLGSWSTHVRSWVDQTLLPMRVIQYEQLKADTVGEFARVVEFLGHTVDQDRLNWAIEQSSFSELQRQEDTEGFVERPHGAASFFRKGKVGDWREALSSAQVDRVVGVHGELMERFGYLP